MICHTGTTAGIPNCLVEACQFSKPIISSTSSLIHASEICRKKNGFLYGTGNTALLSAMILKLADDPKMCREMGDAGRDIVEKEFNILIQAEKYREIYLK